MAVLCTQCRNYLAKWVRDYAAEHDAGAALAQPCLPLTDSEVVGLAGLFDKAHVPGTVADGLKVEIATMGAIDVSELRRADWEALRSWPQLRELEKRRLSVALGF